MHGTSEEPSVCVSHGNATNLDWLILPYFEGYPASQNALANQNAGESILLEFNIADLFTLNTFVVG